MTKEPENLTHVMLRDIRAKQDEHSTRLERIETWLGDVERQFDGYKKIVRYSLGQSSETQFRQAEQESHVNGLFYRLEKLLSDKAPA
jgi:hypothetical protein